MHFEGNQNQNIKEHFLKTKIVKCPESVIRPMGILHSFFICDFDQNHFFNFLLKLSLSLSHTHTHTYSRYRISHWTQCECVCLSNRVGNRVTERQCTVVCV